MRILEPYTIQSYRRSIDLLYRKISDLKQTGLTDRVAVLSALFVGRPYVLGPNGEGVFGEFDQAPFYRLDSFDCVTYVNTVLALALSQDVLSFEKNLIRIAYQKEELRYVDRNHFISVDWNPHNQSIGILKEETPHIARMISEECLQIAEAFIDRPGWFSRRSLNEIRLLKSVSEKRMEQLLRELRGLSAIVEPQQSQLPYLPIRSLFDRNAQPIASFFKRIPHAAVIEIVRPNWHVKEKIGTNINVSHIGFAVWENDRLLYRHASSTEQCVTEVSLTEYLRNCLASPTIKGISIYCLND